MLFLRIGGTKGRFFQKIGNIPADPESDDLQEAFTGRGDALKRTIREETSVLMQKKYSKEESLLHFFSTYRIYQWEAPPCFPGLVYILNNTV